VINAVNQGKIFFYLSKPWSNDEIGAVISKGMEHHHLLRENKRLVEELRSINARLEERIKDRTLLLEQRALELEEANREISDLVYIDPLTGTANRRRLDETMSREIERSLRLNLPLTVILLDIDHFKKVNDSFGHAVGDKVLCAIAQLLMKSVRQYDLVARYGGEEFLIMMPGTVLTNGAASAERFRKAINGLSEPDVPKKVSASFGVAELKPNETGKIIFERADRALYRAKEGGRN
jgi:diguanylate cyclase (GGDEF)-like protein